MISTVISTVRLPRLRAVVVAEESMTPTLRPGDCLVVLVGARIRPGDIVIARAPTTPTLLLVKRATRRDDDGWWLQSDNSEVGVADSRRYGTFPESAIIGRVLFRYYPWRRRRLSA